MIIDTLNIEQFRNISGLSISLSSHTNLIHGDNGSGKTSILEAIYLLSYAKSFLTTRRENMIRHGQDSFRLSGHIIHPTGDSDLVFFYNGSSSILCNGEKVNVSEISRYLFPVFFSSHTFTYLLDHRTELRRVFNRFIYGVNYIYLHYILRYNHCLRQKNHLLRNSLKKISTQELSGWNRELSATGAELLRFRSGFVETLNRVLQEKSELQISIEYHSTTVFDSLSGEESMYSMFCSYADREIRSKKSLFGPHRDYYEIFVNQKNINSYSSGEKKKYLLFLYNAYIEMYREVNNDYPVFLIDDFDAAMDKANLDYLMASFPSMQLIATSVETYKKFHHYIPLNKGDFS